MTDRLKEVLWQTKIIMGSSLDRLLKNPSHIIARSSFCDEAISNPLILLKARLPRFARNDEKEVLPW